MYMHLTASESLPWLIKRLVMRFMDPLQAFLMTKKLISTNVRKLVAIMTMTALWACCFTWLCFFHLGISWFGYDIISTFCALWFFLQPCSCYASLLCVDWWRRVFFWLRSYPHRFTLPILLLTPKHTKTMLFCGICLVTHLCHFWAESILYICAEFVCVSVVVI